MAPVLMLDANLLNSLGTESFPDELSKWIVTLGVPLPYYMVAFRYQINKIKKLEIIEPIFSIGQLEQSLQEKGKELFIKEQAWEYDFATSYILAAKEHQIVIQNGNSKTYGSYGYVFKEAALGQECLMLGCHNNYVYTFSIFQREGDQFSLTHINKFHSVLNPFIALLSKHTELFLIRNDYDFLVHRFENKLDVRQIKLSPQEFTICVHTLKGHQVAQIADMLQLKECSVRTYLNRALNKLDLDNKYKLFIWAINR